jgi:dTDP-4-dehydrorhamnose 3,5-epimerase
MKPKKVLVLGAGGQLGQAFAEAFPDADTRTRAQLDLTDAEAVAAFPWHEYAVVLNAAAYTAVDAAETDEGRVAAWAANATGPATLAGLAREHRFTLVHFSSEYVFDGTAEDHVEDEPLSPLGVYAQSKAAGDLAVGLAPRHYILRTSWVIGDGKNFVRTMQALAEKGVSPSVVDDQVGRLTFTDELVRATRHLIESGADFGTYHVSNGGPAMSWREVAQAVFERSGRSAADVSGTSTSSYADGVLANGNPFAPRPLRSAMSLEKIRATGFEPEDALVALDRYLA